MMDANIDLMNHTFIVPKREIFRCEDMSIWEVSKAYKDFIDCVTSLNETVKGIPISAECYESENIKQLHELLEKLDRWIDEIPPLTQPQRYGNRAYAEWYNKLKEEAPNLLETALPQEFHRAIPELNPYLTEGFGNSIRIDYGTGHEMCFGMLICCFYKIGVFSPEDNVAVVIRIFNRYLKLVRKLQVTYHMEPAGSHGVWNLDDYQFLPFLWGSAQLVEHDRLVPRTFLEPSIVKENSNEYMFLDCVRFINEVKRGPFSEHSNILWNISSLGSWETINNGLKKMYKVEVLGKFPIIQHTLFGSLMDISPL